MLAGLHHRDIYGDKESNPWPVSSTGSHPAPFKINNQMKGPGRSIYFAFRDSKWYARPVTLRNPALIQCDAGYKAAGSL